MDVEIGDEACPLVLVLVGSMNGDGHVVVTEGGERGHQPGNAVGELVTSTVVAWGGRGVVLGEEGDGVGATGGSELHVHVVGKYVDIRVEDDVEVQADEVSYDWRVG